MFLVLIETSGNQNYIFSTNKLRENVGASELTFRAGTKWILEAVAQNGGHPSLGIWKKGLQGGDQIRENEIRQRLTDATQNPPIESNQNYTAEIVLATSGKALILTRDQAVAKAIIQSVTLRALESAPGLDVFGVYEAFDWASDTLSDVNERVHRRFAAARSRHLTHHLRFLRLPVVDQCATSGMPATYVDRRAPGGKPVLRSPVAQAKRENYTSNLERIEALLERNQLSQTFAQSIQHLIEGDEQGDRRIDWLAVIHADGNGLGEIFLKFGQHLKKLGKMTGTVAENNRVYVDALRRFSLALDVCTEQAFIAVLKSFGSGFERLPIIPLVLGGDDLTVVCDGQVALRFTQQFLVAFEAETHKQDEQHYGGIIHEIAKAALGVSRLSACAGVAIIKPHFPFSVAYELSESLMQSAKEVKRKLTHTLPGATSAIPYPCSALDFHVLYDTSGVNLSHIRQRLEPETDTRLYIAPYVTTPLENLDISPAMHEWVKPHQWSHLEDRVKAINAKDEDGRRILPNSQMHYLRSALLQGVELADGQFRLIRDRYLSTEENRIDMRAIEGSSTSLFTEVVDPVTNKKLKMTGLLDALDAADFLSTDIASESTDEQENA